MYNRAISELWTKQDRATQRSPTPAPLGKPTQTKTKVPQLTPIDKDLYNIPIFSFLSIPHTCHNATVI